jgi:hypothetical protein
MGAGKGGKN